MKGRITLIAPDAPEPQITEYSSEIPLGDLQRLVGGNIEIVPYWTTVPRWITDYASDSGARMPCCVFCNEEGKLNQMPRNDPATALWLEAIAADFRHRGTPQGDYLVGPVAIVTGDTEFMEAL
jgi:hypothetical protein